MDPPPYIPAHSQAMRNSDFDTASIRSAAPSYISEAPTYYSLLPATECNRGHLPASIPRRSTLPTLSSSGTSAAGSKPPSLDDFRMSTWSPTSNHPKARHYANVAQRRASIASAQKNQELLAAASSPRLALQLMEEKAREAENALKPLEDPYLVGEEAAEEARLERLRRQGRLGDEVLIREDKRWDWLLGQMADWDERERSWGVFRKEVQGRGKLARALRRG
jgi:hypothetical protein